VPHPVAYNEGLLVRNEVFAQLGNGKASSVLLALKGRMPIGVDCGEMFVEFLTGSGKAKSSRISKDDLRLPSVLGPVPHHECFFARRVNSDAELYASNARITVPIIFLRLRRSEALYFRVSESNFRHDDSSSGRASIPRPFFMEISEHP
jgi:hypothetical protein